MAARDLHSRIIISALDRASRVIANIERNAITRLTSIRKASDKVSDIAFKTGRNIGTVGVVAGAALYKPVEMAVKFEKEMSAVKKVVDGMNDEKTFQKMSQDILKMGRVIPIAHSELVDLVAAGGRMGIPRRELLRYTKDVAIMSMAFDTAAGKIGEDMAKLANVMKIPIKGIRGVADAINYLDDNTTAKGAEIIEVMRRAGGVAQQIGMKAPGVAALASTFLSLGSGVEVAGTASNALMRELSIANIQGDKFRTGLKGIGMNAKEVAKGMAVDPQKTILKVLDGINALPKSKQVEVTTQLFGKEYGDDIAKLSQGIGEYRRQLKLANDPRLNGSMQREFAIRSKTSAAQIQLLKNNVNEFLITLGTGLLPILNKVIQRIIPVVQRFTTWVQKNQKLATSIMMVVAGFAAFSLATSGIAFLVGGIARTISAVSQAAGIWIKISAGGAKLFLKMKPILVGLTKFLGLAGRAFMFVGRAILLMGRAILLNPIGLAITAIALGAYLIYRNWDKVKAFFIKLWAGIKRVTAIAWEGIKQVFFKYHPVGLIIKNWATIKTFFSGLWAGVKKTFYEAGQGIMSMLWKGMQAMFGKPVALMKKLVKKIRDFLPFSPAKEGPLRDLHRVRIVETVVESMKKAAPMAQRAGRIMAQSLVPGGSLVGAAFAGSNGGGQGITVNFSPTINMGPGQGGGIGRDELIEALRRYQGDLMSVIEQALLKKNRTKY